MVAQLVVFLEILQSFLIVRMCIKVKKRFIDSETDLINEGQQPSAVTCGDCHGKFRAAAFHQAAVLISICLTGAVLILIAAGLTAAALISVCLTGAVLILTAAWLIAARSGTVCAAAVHGIVIVCLIHQHFPPFPQNGFLSAGKIVPAFKDLQRSSAGFHD